MVHEGPLHNAISAAHKDKTLCDQCLGCGKIANSDDGESWLYWLNLEPPANLAVTIGLVKPLPCPTCGGAGKRAAS